MNLKLNDFQINKDTDYTKNTTKINDILSDISSETCSKSNDISYCKICDPKCKYLDCCHEKSSWTFNEKYFGSKEINKSLKFMEMIHVLLNENDIKMSVGIYPWPAQIMHDTKDSKIVSLIEEFCKNKCEFFFNNFPKYNKYKI